MNERLKAKEWMVAVIPTHSEAAKIVRRWHYAKGSPNTSTYRFGLYRVVDYPLTGEAFGVSMWIPPTKNAALTVNENWQGVLSLSRFVIDPEVPANGASFLLRRSMDAIDMERWPTLLTYADTAQGHTGAIYKATGWREIGEVPAGDTWVDARGAQCGRKRGGTTLTVAQMKQRGCTRLPSQPKIKFVFGALLDSLADKGE